MELTQQEEALLVAVRCLPLDAAARLTALAQRLASLASQSTVDWSDSWSEADLRDYSAASAERLVQEQADEPC
jgi:hypothetical protein